MPFPVQNAQLRMWNKPSVHPRGGGRNLIVEVSMPDYRRRHDVFGLEVPTPGVETRVRSRALGALAQRFAEAVQHRDADARGKHLAIGLRQAAEPQQSVQQLR